MGLGSGGPSRLGMQAGRTDAECAAVVRAALDLGVNLMDTAEGYGTESYVGRALREAPREQVILSTKKTVKREGRVIPPGEVAPALEASLARLQTDHVDIYHLHAVRPEHYEQVRDTLAPRVLKLRDQGKVRFLGITENFRADPAHAMLERAVEDDCWDVLMVGFNLINQSARRHVLPAARERGIGTLIMQAMRRPFLHPERLRALLAELAARGRVDGAAAAGDDPLGSLLHPGGAESLPDAAYRFCRHTPGVDVVLVGSGSVKHLRADAESLSRPDLPPEDRAYVERLFERVDDTTGD